MENVKPISSSATASRAIVNQIETVPPANGRLEDKVVLSIVIALFILSSSLLYLLYGAPNNNKVIVPKGLHQHLTALSNAADELSIGLEFGDTLPSIDTLIADNIAPFSGQAIGHMSAVEWQQHGHCYLGHTLVDNSDYQMRLLFSNQNGADIAWREHQKESLEQACSDNEKSSWNPVNTLSVSHSH